MKKLGLTVLIMKCLLLQTGCLENGFKSIDAPVTSPVTTTTSSSTTSTTTSTTTTSTTLPTTTTSTSTSTSTSTTTSTSTSTTTTTLPPSSGTAPVTFLSYPSFTTAGLITKLPASSAANVAGKIYYKKTSESDYQEGFPFTKYDLNNMATSLFSLETDTDYDYIVFYDDGSGTYSSKSGTFHTKADRGVSYPAAVRTVNVSTLSELQTAINASQPGDHIVVASGTYVGTVTISSRVGTYDNPVVIRGADFFDPFNPGASPRAIFDGNLSGKTFSFTGSAYFILDNVEITNAGTGFDGSGNVDYSGYGVELYSSSNITVQRSYLHDNGHYNIRLDRSSSYAAFGDQQSVGYHIIQNNFITDTSDRSACDANPTPYNGCQGITYEGIAINKLTGGGNVIRNNRITNMIDAITVPGDGNAVLTLPDTTAHVLKMTDSSGVYMNHDNEIMGNEIYDNHDDDIECDGIGVNIRIVGNTLGSDANPTTHPLTSAPFLPGPLFIVRNVIKNYDASVLKLNTGGSPSVASRNIYFYHNTIYKLQTSNSGAMLNLWYGSASTVTVRNLQMKNNIFYSPNGGRATDINASNYGDTPGTTLDYNLWYSPTSSSTMFEWYDGSTIQTASSLSGFTSISGQETHGVFDLPDLNASYELQNTSPAIDAGVRIPGINNQFNGSAPDLGADEY